MNVDITQDELHQQAIPDAWRRTLFEVVEAFRAGDFRLSAGIPGVRPLPDEEAERIAANLDVYGAHLASLPEPTWKTSGCQWMLGHWDAWIDLYTVEEGRSDLALFVTVVESADGFEFQVESVHVP